MSEYKAIVSPFPLAAEELRRGCLSPRTLQAGRANHVAELLSTRNCCRRPVDRVADRGERLQCTLSASESRLARVLCIGLRPATRRKCRGTTVRGTASTRRRSRRSCWPTGWRTSSSPMRKLVRLALCELPMSIRSAPSGDAGRAPCEGPRSCRSCPQWPPHADNPFEHTDGRASPRCSGCAWQRSGHQVLGSGRSAAPAGRCECPHDPPRGC